MGGEVPGMAVHRVLPMMLFMVIAGAMAAGGDTDYGAFHSEGSELGEAQLDMTQNFEEDDPVAPFDAHEIDDAVTDESIEKPTFWKSCDFKGTHFNAMEQIADVTKVGVTKEDIASLKVPNGFGVTLYSEKDYQGDSKTFTAASVHCLSFYHRGEETWENSVQSMKVMSPKPPPAEDVEEKKEKTQQIQREQEKQAEKTAKTKIKMQQDIAAEDAKKAAQAETATKNEKSAEAKVKAETRDADTAQEYVDAAVNKEENAQKNQVLNHNEQESSNKQSTEKEGKTTEQKAREGVAIEVAKAKLAEMNSAKKTSDSE